MDSERTIEELLLEMKDIMDKALVERQLKMLETLADIILK